MAHSCARHLLRGWLQALGGELGMERFVTGLLSEPFPHAPGEQAAWLMSALGNFERQAAAWGGAGSGVHDWEASLGPSARFEPHAAGSGGLPVASLPGSVQRAVFELEQRLGGQVRAEDFDGRVVYRLMVSLTPPRLRLLFVALLAS